MTGTKKGRYPEGLLDDPHDTLDATLAKERARMSIDAALTYKRERAKQDAVLSEHTDNAPAEVRSLRVIRGDEE